MDQNKPGWFARWGKIIAFIVGVLAIIRFLFGVQDVPEIIETIDASNISIPVVVSRPLNAAESSTTPLVNTNSPIPTPPIVSPHTQYRFDNFSSTETGWNEINHPTGTANYSGRGEYQFDLAGNYFFAGLWKNIGPVAFEDFILEAKALGPWGDTGADEQAVVLGWNDDYVPAYAFALSPTGYCRFKEQQLGEEGPNEGERVWKTKNEFPISGFDKTKSTHNLLLVKRNNTLYGYIDGQFCGLYEMDDYQSGYVGLAMLGPDAGGKSYFDEFAIYSIP